MKELKDKDVIIANLRMAGYKNMSPGPDEGNFFVELPKPRPQIWAVLKINKHDPGSRNQQNG